MGGPVPPLGVYKPWLGSPRCQWHPCLALGTGSTPGLSEPAGSRSSPRDAECREGGQDVPGGLGLLFSCENWVLWGGICSSPALKTTQLEAAFGGCFPPSIPTLLNLFLLGLDLKRVVEIRKNSTNVFSAVSNWELNPKAGSEQGCATLSSAGNQEHRERGVLIPVIPEPAGMGGQGLGCVGEAWSRSCPFP